MMNTTSFAPTKTRTSFAQQSKASVGKVSTISKRSKAIPIKKLFNTEIETVKEKNLRKLRDESDNEEAENTKVGRWQRKGDRQEPAIQDDAQSPAPPKLRQDQEYKGIQNISAKKNLKLNK